MAPEMILLDNTESDRQRYSTAVDIYAFGIILNAMWRRARPYSKIDFDSPLTFLQDVKSGNLRPKIPEDCPEWLGSLMEKCWAQEPRERPSALEVSKALAQGADAQRIGARR
jgi:mitogen-activated protein kinase kinase kinase 7